MISRIANPSPLLLDRNEIQGLWVGTLNCRALCALALVALGHDAFREPESFVGTLFRRAKTAAPKPPKAELARRSCAQEQRHLKRQTQQHQPINVTGSLMRYSPHNYRQASAHPKPRPINGHGLRRQAP